MCTRAVSNVSLSCRYMHTHDCVGHVDGLQEMAMGGDHIWVDTNASGDFCYVGDADCMVSVRCALQCYDIHLLQSRQ